MYRIFLFFQKEIVTEGNIKLNISWASRFLEKYLIFLPVNFCSLFNECICVQRKNALSNIQDSIHKHKRASYSNSNVQIEIFTEMLHKV